MNNNEKIVYDTNKGEFQAFSDSDIINACRVVNSILEAENFTLDISEYAVGDEWYGEVYEEHRFNLIDKQGGNLGNIENDSFSNLAEVIDRLDIYHKDYFYEALEKRMDEGEHISGKDYDREVIMFLESDFCNEMLQNITPSVYENYSKTADLQFFSHMPFISIEELLNKDIALKTIGSQELFNIAEIGNFVCCGYDVCNNNNDFKDLILKILEKDPNKKVGITFLRSLSNMGIYWGSYSDIFYLNSEQIKEDLNDLGTEGHYLSQNEFEYIGMGEQYAHAKNLELETAADNAFIENIEDSSNDDVGVEEPEI